MDRVQSLSVPLFNFESLHSKVFCLSDGTLTLQPELEARGATFVSDLTQEVDLLIVKSPTDNQQNQKLALSMGIPVLTEAFISVNMRSGVDRKRKCLSPARTDETLKKPRHSESRTFRDIQDSAISEVQLQRTKHIAHEQHKTYLNHVVALEGNIGAGKSTLCAKLKEEYPNKCALYKEQGNEMFLQLFYSNPQKYGFAYQWGMLKTRKFQLKLAQKDLKYGRALAKQFYFWDRSMVGDYIFALWNHLQGSISHEEMAVYEDEFGGSMKHPEKISFLGQVTCYIFLNDEPSSCKRRVEEIRGNKSESGIPLPYYEGIDDIHFDLFIKRVMALNVAPVLVMSWGQYHNPTTIWDLMDSIMNNTVKLPTVKLLEKEKENVPNSDFHGLVYSSEKQITQFYNEVVKPNFGSTDRGDAFSVKDYYKHHETVYIPINIMTIDPKAKGVREDNDYDITFYTNVYKRVVLWHLSCFQNLVFYVI